MARCMGRTGAASRWAALLSMLGLLTVAPGAAGAKPGPYGLPALGRADFNRIAAQLGVPLLWAQDGGSVGTLEPSELVALGVAPAPDRYVKGGVLTAEFEAAYRRLVEARRLEALRSELDQGLPTLVLNDLTGLSKAERTFMGHMATAAELIGALYLSQRGASGFAGEVNAGGALGKAVFARNQGPWCVAPRTEDDPFCNALPSFPARRWNAYPADEAHDSALCERLRALPNGRELLAPFTVVRKRDGKYVALGLLEEYGEQMRGVAAALKAAAAAISSPEEAALERYLLAAAAGFETNTWGEADEAWAAMNATNSRWYLRIAPDEVYWDLCQEKAGFHMSFARIDRRSLQWQAKLNPLRGEMESSVATLIGPPYKARQVQFQMPDFIEILINAGNSRSPMGATIGQSLPNWGAVAEEGRGRTVVMTNLYTDPDSVRMSREKAASLLTPGTMTHYTDDPEPGIIDIILHEATHNLGPHSDYKVGGRDPSEVFGGRLASVLEELKAQTGGLYYVELLRRHKVISDAVAKQLYTHSLVWAFGHISRGMFTPSGNPKAYSQLAAVQVGFLSQQGALSWQVADDPETGRRVGRFHVHFDKFPKAIELLMQKVGRIKAKGDAAGARALIDPYVTGEHRGLVHQDEVARRILRYAKGSMVYSLSY